MPYFMKKAREPISSYTHFCGAILFGVGAILLFLKAFAGGETDKRTLFSLLAFGCSITALYSGAKGYLPSAKIGSFHYLHFNRWNLYTHSVDLSGTTKGRRFYCCYVDYCCRRHCNEIMLVPCAPLADHFFIFADGLGHPGRCINLFPYEYRRFVAPRIGRCLLYHRRRDLWPEKTQSFCQDRLS